MAYNFPDSPFDGQVFAPVGSPGYIWQGGAWRALTPPIDWAAITGKPSTFPPTLPIPSSGVTGLDAALALKAPLAGPLLTGNVGIGNATPLAALHIGPGTDAPTLAAPSTVLLLENNGLTSMSIRDASSNVEAFMFALSTGGAVGTFTLHPFDIKTSNNTRLTIDNAGNARFTSSLKVDAWFGTAAPVTKTSDFTVGTTENWINCNKPAANCAVTLPAAASFPGRGIFLKQQQAFTVISASANVIPFLGGAATTAILSGIGKTAMLVSNATAWEIMDAN